MGTRRDDVLKWYDTIEARPGIYTGRDEAGLGDTVSPMERLNERFLKRLYGNEVSLVFGRIEGLGDTGVLEIETFDFEALRRNGMVSAIPFTTDTGVSGTASVDWVSRVVTFRPVEGESVQVSMLGFYNASWSYQVAYRIGFGFHVVWAPLFGSDADWTREGVVASDGGRQDNMMSRYYVDVAIAHLTKGRGFFSDRPLTVKGVSEITGIPASTLSNLKTGKRAVDNLTVNTFALLSFVGQIHDLDSAMVTMLAREDLHATRIVREETEEILLREDVPGRHLVFYEAIATGESNEFNVRLPLQQYAVPLDAELEAMLRSRKAYPVLANGSQ